MTSRRPMVTVACKYGCGRHLKRRVQSATQAACPECSRLHHMQVSNERRRLRNSFERATRPAAIVQIRLTNDQVLAWAYWGN